MGISKESIMSATPLWNKVIIYIGILFAFVVVSCFITILTPSISNPNDIEIQKKDPENFMKNMRRQSYMGLGAMLFANLVVIATIFVMGYQSMLAEKNRNRPKDRFISSNRYKTKT